MPDDAELLRGSVDDPHVFESVFDRHYDAILRYARQRVGHDAGEEIAATTMLIAFERRLTYDGRYPSARAWLYGIATNLIRHHFRDEKTHLAAIAKLPIDPAPEDIADPERLDALLTKPALVQALRTLQPGDRDAFLLLALADLSYEEIAEALRVPMGTVKSRIHRARHLLREQIQGLEATTASKGTGRTYGRRGSP